MKLSADTVEKLEPLTREVTAFLALRTLIDQAVSIKKIQHDRAAAAALHNVEARTAGLIAYGELKQALEIQSFLQQVSGVQNITEDKQHGNI